MADATAPAAPQPVPVLRRRGTLALLALVLVVIAVGAWWFFLRADAAPGFRFAKVERGALTSVVSASGTLSAVTTVAVGSQISGQIKELTVDYNSPVKQGQLLARIDPETFEIGRASCRERVYVLV